MHHLSVSQRMGYGVQLEKCPVKRLEMYLATMWTCHATTLGHLEIRASASLNAGSSHTLQLRFLYLFYFIFIFISSYYLPFSSPFIIPFILSLHSELIRISGGSSGKGLCGRLHRAGVKLLTGHAISSWTNDDDLLGRGSS